MNKYLTILLLGVTLLACNTEKRLQKAVNKHGQKESMEYMIKRYPEYFIDYTFTDTVLVPVIDTLKVPEITLDTLFIPQPDGTFVAENESLKIQIYKLNNELRLKGTCKEREIIVEREVSVPVEVTKPCPELFLTKNTINSLEKEVIKYRNRFFTSLIISLFLILTIVYFVYKSLK
jgi:hypothetical protein